MSFVQLGPPIANCICLSALDLDLDLIAYLNSLIEDVSPLCTLIENAPNAVHAVSH